MLRGRTPINRVGNAMTEATVPLAAVEDVSSELNGAVAAVVVGSDEKLIAEAVRAAQYSRLDELRAVWISLDYWKSSDEDTVRLPSLPVSAPTENEASGFGKSYGEHEGCRRLHFDAVGCHQQPQSRRTRASRE